MSAILRLYPRAWRERYGDELAALLEEHPSSLADQIDLIRGALDARLHPRVPGADVAPGREFAMDRKVLGLLAAIGGLAWIAAGATMFLLPRTAEGDRDTSLAFIEFAVGMALIGTALGGLGTRPGSRTSTQTGVVISVISIVMALAAPWPWPLFIGALLVFPFLTFGATLRGYRNGVLPAWIVVAFVLAAIGLIAGMDGSVHTDTGLALFMLPGFAGLLLAATALLYHGKSAAMIRPVPKTPGGRLR